MSRVRPVNPVRRGPGHGGSSRATHRYRKVGERRDSQHEIARRCASISRSTFQARRIAARSIGRRGAHASMPIRIGSSRAPRHTSGSATGSRCRCMRDRPAVSAGRRDTVTQRERREANPTTARRVKCGGREPRSPGRWRSSERPHLEARPRRVRRAIPARAPIGASSPKCRPRRPSSA